MSLQTILAILVLSLVAMSILILIGLIVCMVVDEVNKTKIDKYMISCGFTKEIDRIYHLNNGEKYFYKFTRPYYDEEGNISTQVVKAEVVYRISYKEVKRTYSNKIPSLPKKVVFENTENDIDNNDSM